MGFFSKEYIGKVEYFTVEYKKSFWGNRYDVLTIFYKDGGEKKFKFKRTRRVEGTYIYYHCSEVCSGMMEELREKVK